MKCFNPPGISPSISVCLYVSESLSVGVLVHIYVCECPCTRLFWIPCDPGEMTVHSLQSQLSEHTMSESEAGLCFSHKTNLQELRSSERRFCLVWKVFHFSSMRLHQFCWWVIHTLMSHIMGVTWHSCKSHELRFGLLCYRWRFKVWIFQKGGY